MHELAALSLDQLPLLFLDFETTGLELAAGHRICEVALLRERAGVEESRLNSLVAPGRLLDPEAAAVNGLNNAELAAAPTFAALADAVEQLANGAVLVAHNLPFDQAFLAVELNALGRAPLLNPALDTLALARRLLRRPSYSLAALSAEFGLPRPTHRAMDDVLALRGLFSRLRLLMNELEVRTLGDAMRLERGLLPGAPEPEVPPLIALALAENRPLRIVYRSRSSPSPTERVVRPIYLSREQNGVYLRAYCELRQDVRAFALDKIEAMELL